jgi:hypothetical protein
MEEAVGFAVDLQRIVAGLFDGHFQGAVEDQAEGAVVAVLDEEDDGVEEIGVRQAAGGEEELAG